MENNTQGEGKRQAIMQLHNELERRGLPREFSWKEKRTGPLHSPVWQMDLFINDTQCGRGFGQRKRDAKHAACAQYLDVLRAT
ncbi:hypothetical protein EXIGLDRAFT_717658 [Exidia glandulosa HHB12029]|uniref:DRBM domain-containing protein n=1 Tax=Exidia glandulosa HHB12029 TaxID=1314781 RepID=A0A165I7D8_EXIGL|nr:hypothetical protein EXIGLDRAFT_717658 [Exidia glandulosa HHB12029]